MPDPVIPERTMADVLGKSNVPALSATSADDAPKLINQEGAESEQTATTEQTGATGATGAAEKTEGATAAAEGATGADDTERTERGLKTELTKERNRRRAAEETAKTASDQLAQALALAERAGAAPAKQTQAAIDKSDPKPTRESFSEPDAYETALIEWASRTATRIATAEGDKTRAEQAEGQRMTKLVTDWQASQSKFAAEHPDFEELVFSDDLKITENMRMAMLEAENGVAIAYYLGQHPDEAAKIAGMSGPRQVFAIGKLEARLETPTVAATKTNGKAAPIEPLRSNNRSVSKDPSEMSMEEFAAQDPDGQRYNAAQARRRH